MIRRPSLRNFAQLYRRATPPLGYCRLYSYSRPKTPTSNSFRNKDIRNAPTKRPTDRSLFAKVEKVISTPKGETHPKYLSFECEYLMKECCKLQTAKGIQNAINLLHRLLEEKRFANQIFLEQRMKEMNQHHRSSTNAQFIVKDSFFHILMFAQQPRRIYSQKKMEEMLQLMAKEYELDMETKEKFDQSGSPSMSTEGWIDKREKRLSCMPTTSSYNILLTALANASRHDPKAAKNAEGILDKMVSLQHEKRWHTKPNTQSYELVIQAYENSCISEAGGNALRVFDRMKASHEKELTEYRHNCVSGIDYDFHDASKNYRQIVVPSAKATLSVIHAYCKSNAKGAVKLAEEFLLACIPKGDDNNNNNSMQSILDETLFHAVIKAWGQSARKMSSPKARFAAAANAERLLEMMKGLASECDATSGVNTNHCAPTTETYNLCLDAWSHCDVKEASTRATLLLDELLLVSKDVNPDQSSFHALMNTFARSFPHDPNAAIKAEETITQMSNLHESGKYGKPLKPTTWSYSIAINAWAKSKETHDENGIHKAINSRRLLDTLLERHMVGENDMKPSIHAFTSVLSACAFSGKDDMKDIMSIAIKTYEEVRDDIHDLNVSGDEFFFATMLAAVRNQVPEGSSIRMPLIERIYGEAKEAGCAGPKVIRELRTSCTKDELRSLLGKD